MEVDAQKSLKTALKIDPNLTAPVTAGQRVGTATVSAPRFPGVTVPVYAAKDIARAGIFQRLMRMIRK
jgi:D-alanyl-D-alanine carboxypeptidase (penicillin-binding protein 5/6)